MDFRDSKIAHYFLFAAVLAICIGGAHAAFNGLINYQNRKQLETLNDLVLQRSVLAVDYAFIALGELAEKGIVECGPTTADELRRQAYRRGSIKDILLIDEAGKILCSAFPEVSEVEKQVFSTNEKIAGRNSRIQLAALRNQSDVALAVVWSVIAESSLVAVINMDAILFDVLPEALRENGQVSLRLSSGTIIASYPTVNSPSDPMRSPPTFSANSDRYPLVASLYIDTGAISAWNKEQMPFALGVGLLLGILIGSLTGGLIRKPSDPVRDLDRALERNEFKAFMQPIFSLKTKEIVGCEVLARWIRQDGTVVPPYRFIPLAEDSGRLKLLTKHIVADALQHLQPWMKRHKKFKVGINIGASQLLAAGFAEELRGLIAQANVSARQIVIELTERQEVQDLEQAATVIAELREHGFKVAIDDAGTGHSGLSYIQKLAVNTIKIDKLFVDSIEKDIPAKAVVKMLVRLALQLRMTTVAEGIENENQIAALLDCGVDEGQGYVLSPPLTADDFCAFLESRAKLAQASTAQQQVYVGAA